MATVPKPKALPAPDVTGQPQELAERLVDASKKAAAEYLTLTEKAAESFVDIERQIAAQTDVEWVASLIDAHAQFTADVSRVLVSAGRELVK
jgi:hypothetical protein